MKPLLKEMRNLRYVRIDRKAALNHWNQMILSVDTYFWDVNRKQMVITKTTAGILGHAAYSRGFRKHLFRETRINRSLQGKRT